MSLSDSPLLLSASENGLFVYPIQNERIGHPLLLCSNYKSGLSACAYSKTIHYVYINRDNALLVRRLRESGCLFRLDPTDTVTYSNPQLIVFNNLLYLFYIEEQAGVFRLKAWRISPDTKMTLPEALCTPFPVPPHLSLQATEHYLYLILTTREYSVSYRYSSTVSFELLRSQEELLSDLRLPWETEKTRLKETLMKTIHLSEQQQNLLTEKEQALQTTQSQLSDCTESRQQTLRELERTTLLLERAKSQYNELMQVAEQYRQEAMKWYGKFTERH